MRICRAQSLLQVVEGISSLQDQHRGVQLGTQAEECGLDHEEVGMDLFEACMYRIMSRFDCGCDIADNDTHDDGYEITVYWTEQGTIQDITFERIH